MYATTAALFGWLPNLTKLMLLRVQVISSQSTWQSTSLKVDKFGCICFLPKWMKNIFQWKFLIEWRRESSRRIRETAIPHQLVKIWFFVDRRLKPISISFQSFDASPPMTTWRRQRRQQRQQGGRGIGRTIWTWQITQDRCQNTLWEAAAVFKPID